MNEFRGSNSSDYLIGKVSANNRIQGYGGDDSLYGGTRLDTLIGGSGNDKLYGNSNNDLLFGYADNDTLVGGSGSDRFAINVTDFSIDGGFVTIEDYDSSEGDSFTFSNGSADDYWVSGTETGDVWVYYDPYQTNSLQNFVAVLKNTDAETLIVDRGFE